MKSYVINIYRNTVKKTQVLLSDCSQFPLSQVKPHGHASKDGPASKDTISRWCKNVLESAGIDEYKFTVHSTRSASRYDDVSRLV